MKTTVAIQFVLKLTLSMIVASAVRPQETSADPELPLFNDATEIPANFRRENLIAWCIVPFDAKKRSPEARSQMLVDLGLKRCAYDWRDEHVPTFEREITAYKDKRIEFSAFWGEHDDAFRLFRQHDMRPQVWRMIPQPAKDATQEEKVAQSVATMTRLAKRCKSMNCQLGLYNHGGWAGQPENLVAVCRGLRDEGYADVGIVYNLHHAHDQISDDDRFAKSIAQLKPFLLCLNLNGMVDLDQFKGQPDKQAQFKIQPIGHGQHEAAMIQTVVASGYDGPIGVLGHVASRDVKQVLQENVEGLEYLLGARTKPAWLSALDEADYMAKWTPKARANSKFDYEAESDPDWVDERSQEMDTGQSYCHSITVPIKRFGDGENDDDTDDKSKQFVKAIAIKSKTADKAHLLFDTQQLNLAAAWHGEFISIPPARFGILRMPSAKGDVLWSDDSELRWQSLNDNAATTVPDNETRFDGYYLLANNHVGFEYTIRGTKIREISHASHSPSGFVLSRRINRMPSDVTIRMPLSSVGKQSPEVSTTGKCNLLIEDNTLYAILPATPKEVIATIKLSRGTNEFTAEMTLDESTTSTGSFRESFRDFDRQRWGPPIARRGVISDDEESAFVVDSLDVPLENEFKALTFTSGLDFLDANRAFVCTVHGDVWLVNNIDDELNDLEWKRFATGLYQPLGLKVVDGKPIVMCRDRLTRLHDKNGDGEADYYENFNDDLHVTGQSHAYAMSLETDPQGNFYFIKSGGSAPHGGTMLRLTADGKDLSVHATGYRHANGIGVSLTGVVTSADNEGNWVPATRLDIVQHGGFYGHMPTHRRDTKPETYDPPLLWMPRSIDNSAGGQVWVPDDNPAWAPLAGKMIHFSFGRCTANVVLPQKIGDKHQAAIYRLDIPAFKSGSMRGRFNPADGHLYVCGLDGWQTAAVQDGHFQRIRATGKPFYQPTDFAVFKDRMEISFDQPLDRATIANLKNWTVQQWNYRWTKDYGSDHYSVIDPEKVGHDDVKVSRTTLSKNGKIATLFIDDLRPVMQMSIRADIKAADGHAVNVELFNTIHALE